MPEVNIYNEHPLQLTYYQLWVSPDGVHWHLQDGCECLRHKPIIVSPMYKTRVVEVIQTSRVIDQIPGLTS